MFPGYPASRVVQEFPPPEFGLALVELVDKIHNIVCPGVDNYFNEAISSSKGDISRTPRGKFAFYFVCDIGKTRRVTLSHARGTPRHGEPSCIGLSLKSVEDSLLVLGETFGKDTI